MKRDTIFILKYSGPEIPNVIAEYLNRQHIKSINVIKTDMKDKNSNIAVPINEVSLMGLANETTLIDPLFDRLACKYMDETKILSKNWVKVLQILCSKNKTFLVSQILH